VVRLATNGDELRDRPIGDLLRQLSQETSTLVKTELELAKAEASRLAQETTTLVKQELQLAKAEMGQKARQAGPGFGMVGAAAVAALLALGSLTAFAILVLDGVMPNGLAALIVTAVWAAVAAGLCFTGKERVQEAGPLVPEQTIESIKEDVEWAKTQVGSESK
jgi:uncharacterized membrane protein YqjE